MMSSLSLPVRRFAALGILAVLLLLAWQILIEPLADMIDKSHTDTIRNAKLIGAYKKVIREEPQWAELLKKMNAAPYTELFINTNDADLAGAQLQQKIKEITESSGADISSIQILPQTKDRGLNRVDVRVNFTIPLERFYKLFARFDDMRPAVFADNILITAPDNDPNAGQAPVRLTVDCDLFAYIQPRTP